MNDVANGPRSVTEQSLVDYTIVNKGGRSKQRQQYSPSFNLASSIFFLAEEPSVVYRPG